MMTPSETRKGGKGKPAQTIGDVIMDSLTHPKSGNNQRKIITTVAVCVISVMFLSNVFVDIKEKRSQQGEPMDSLQTMQTKDHLLRDFSMARDQSYGFFDDVRVDEWELMRERIRERKNHNDQVLGPRSKLVFMEDAHLWYQNNWEPDFSCKHERKVGDLGDGAKWLCDPHRIPRTLASPEHLAIPLKTQSSLASVAADYPSIVNSKCLIYTVGNKGNFQFEYAIRRMLGKETCEIHVFDNSRHFSGYKDLSGLKDNNVFFHAWGLEGSKKKSSNRNVMTFQETVEALGHRHRVIDIFKIDCEGCEWETYEDWFDSDVTIMQAIVEVHGSPPNANDLFETMQKHNYVTYHKEPNTIYSGGKTQVYSFLKLAPDFFI